MGASAASLEVAIVRARYNPFGGAERFVQRALAALSANDLAVTVIARDWTRGDAEGLPVPMRFLKVDPFYVGGIWRDWSFARGVRRAVAGGRFDIVQSHERIPGMPLYRAGDGVHAAWLERRARALPRWRAALLALDPYHAYVRSAERRMFTDPALRAVICNSEMVRGEIRQRFGVDPARLRLLRNGVDTGRFRPAGDEERRAARARLALPAAATVFAFVGSGFERKGLASAIRALAALGLSDARLVVGGTDRRAGRYRDLAARLGVGDRVAFLGGIGDVRPVLHAADAFVLPTLYDPFPNAALEALACGLPLITSTGCGAAELVREGENGSVADPLDVEAIARAMRLQTDPSRRRAMARAARATAEPLTLEAMARELGALYASLLPAAR